MIEAGDENFLVERLLPALSVGYVEVGLMLLDLK
jgi:hypothetical protein